MEVAGPTRHCIIIIIMVSISCSQSNACPDATDDDVYMLTPQLEEALLNNCQALVKLAGIFFPDQVKPVYSVQVNYTVCIPNNQDCRSQCSCWNDVCTNDTGVCPKGHCAANYVYIWGIIPQIASDEIFRSLSICPFIIGGITEFKINIQLNLTSSNVDCNKTIPCPWCQKSPFMLHQYNNFPTALNKVFLFSQPTSPMEKALEAITMKLRGYAAMNDALPWLRYPSTLAFGYAAQQSKHWYGIACTSLAFTLVYTIFNGIMFMLVYKYRHRIYNYVYCYITRDPISSSLFWSFATTLLIFCAIVIITSLLAGGWCVTVFQVVLLALTCFFCLCQLFVTACWKLKKDKTISVAGNCFMKFPCMNKLFQTLLFFYLFSLPHISIFFSCWYFVNLVVLPFSYLLLLTYLVLSFVIVWIVNATFIYLLSPGCLSSNGKIPRRRNCFAILIAVSFNLFNILLCRFVSFSFYDQRGQATTYLTTILGLGVALLSWYLSGNLVRVFNVVTLGKGEDSDDTSTFELDQHNIPTPDTEVDDESAMSYDLYDDQPRTTFRKLQDMVQTVRKLRYAS